MICDTFAFEEVTFHRLILELGLRVFWLMWYLFWKYKMLKMSTREQCQRYYREEKKLSISRDSAESAFSDVKNRIFPFKDLLHLISPSSFLRMYGPFDRRFDLNFGKEVSMPSQDNIWRPSFLSPTGPLTVGDSMMKNDMTATSMKRKLDQLQEFDGQILLDHQRFVSLFQRHLLPSSSRAVPRNEAPNDQPSVPHPSGVLPNTEAPNNHHMLPHLSEALLTAETSPEQPL
ncbi:unnamed protein product [Malus baccata var. baccata]